MYSQSDPQFDLIVDDATLSRWCDGAIDASFVALDTEFERQRTYFAQLCLIQVSIPGAVACIDPLAGLDLGTLFDFLALSSRTKIIHAARQDLEVLHFAGATPVEPLFDTQVAAALAGFPEQIGYADLVQDLLAVQVDKSQTRTNWRQRPLTDKQLHYAADDVRHLGALREALLDQLKKQDRVSWLQEECASVRGEEVIDPPATSAWQRVKGVSSIPDKAFRRAIGLAAWRETAARQRDLPRSWVLKDNDLIAIALRNPGDKRALAAAIQSDTATVRRDGHDIIDVLNAANSDDAPLPARPAALTGDERRAAKQLAAEVQQLAARLEINSSVLLTRKESEQIVRGQLPDRIENGWRGQVLREIVERFCGP